MGQARGSISASVVLTGILSVLQSQLHGVTVGERGSIMFLQILGMTLIVIGLVGFLVSMGAIFYHLFRAQRG